MVRIAVAALALALVACGNTEAPVTKPTATQALASEAPREAPSATADSTVTRKCPVYRDNAGFEYEYDKSLMSASEAESEHCGTRAPVSRTCPKRYANAGDWFSFDPDETTKEEVQKQHCSAWSTFRAQSDGRLVVATDDVIYISPSWSPSWTLALWCADDRLYAVVVSSDSPTNFVNGHGVLPLAYQFGNWESIEDVRNLSWSISIDLENYFRQEAEQEYQESREFQPTGESSSNGEPAPDFEYWIVETVVDDWAESGTHRDRETYRDFAGLWGSYGDAFVGMPSGPQDEFVAGLRTHEYIAFGIPLQDGFAFYLAGAERDVEPVLQECGY